MSGEIKMLRKHVIEVIFSELGKPSLNLTGQDGDMFSKLWAL